MNDLALNIDLEGLDLQEPLKVTHVKPLCVSDLLEAPFQSQEVTVSRIRHSHHEMARLIAAGHNITETARMVGRSYSHVYTMSKSPLFQELIAYYQEQRTEDTLEFASRIRNAASDALEALQERLDNAEALKTGELHKITVDLLDRSGHSPVSRRESRNFNIGLSGEDIKKIKSEAKVIEGDYEEVDAGSDGGTLREAELRDRDPD